MMNIVPAFLAFSSLVTVGELTAQDATLRALHGVPGLAAPVDVFANGNLQFSFDYGEERGPLSLPAGSYALDIRLNGSSILSANVMLAADTDYTAIAHLDASGSPQLSLFTNDTSSLALPQSRLIVRHTAQAPTVDVALEQNGQQVGLFTSVSNGDERHIDVAPGTYAARLRLAGTQNTAFGPVDIALENGFAYAVHAVGDVAGPSFRLLVQRIPLAARVTVVHGIPGLPAPVDVLAGGQTLFSFDFTDIEGPLVLNPGTYPLAVSLQGQTVLSANATVEAGDDVTIVAHLGAQGGNVLTIFPNDVSPSSGQARVTVRHTAAAPAVDVDIDTQGMNVTTVANVQNGQSRTLEAPAGLYAVRLLAAGTQTVAFGPAALNTVADTHYLVYAVGDLNAGTFQLLLQTIDLGAAVPGELATTVGGASCGPTISASDATFDFGAHFFVNVANGDPNGLAMIMVGDSNTNSNGLALPFPLGSLGAPGCFLNTNLIATRPLALDASGSASLPFVVPTTTFGTLPTLYFQYATTTTSNALGIESTEFLELASN